MVKYIELEKIYYRENEEQQKAEYIQRLSSASTIKIPLFIKDKYTQKPVPLFTTITADIYTKTEKIFSLLNTVGDIRNNKENAFYNTYVDKLFNEELVATNAIEGVHSSKKEIEAAKSSDNNTSRFYFLVNKYQKILNGEIIALDQAEDVRSVYDLLLTNEIEQEHLPDGSIFRQEEVVVYGRSGKSDIIHTGMMPESAIIDHIEYLLNFYKDENIPFLVRVAIGHYYFGYIHPFYDGNGRMNRFISSYLLSQRMDSLLAFKLSKKIKDNIKLYDDAFRSVNNPRNLGDATKFVEMFIEILYSSALEISEELSIYASQINKGGSVIYTDSAADNELEKAITFIVYQAMVIGSEMNVKILAENIGKTPQTVRTHINTLIEKQVLEKNGKHLLISKQLMSKIRNYKWE